MSNQTAGKALKGIGSLASLAGQQIDMARQSKYENEVIALKTNMDMARFENEQAQAQQALLLGSINLKLMRTKARQAQIEALNYMTPEEKAAFELETDIKRKRAELELNIETANEQAKQHPDRRMNIGGVSYTPPKEAGGGGTGTDVLLQTLDKFGLPHDATGIKALKDMGLSGVNESGVTFNTNAETGTMSREKIAQLKTLDEQIKKTGKDMDELVKAPELAKVLRGEDFNVDMEIERLQDVRDSLQTERDLLMADEQATDTQPSQSPIVPGSSGMLASPHRQQVAPNQQQIAISELLKRGYVLRPDGTWRKK